VNDRDTIRAPTEAVLNAVFTVADRLLGVAAIIIARGITDDGPAPPHYVWRPGFDHLLAPPALI